MPERRGQVELSNLVWSLSWLCFEQECGLDTFWDPCPPEPVILLSKFFSHASSPVNLMGTDSGFSKHTGGFGFWGGFCVCYAFTSFCMTIQVNYIWLKSATVVQFALLHYLHLCQSENVRQEQQQTPAHIVTSLSDVPDSTADLKAP